MLCFYILENEFSWILNDCNWSWCRVFWMIIGGDDDDVRTRLSWWWMKLPDWRRRFSRADATIQLILYGSTEEKRGCRGPRSDLLVPIYALQSSSSINHMVRQLGHFRMGYYRHHYRQLRRYGPRRQTTIRRQNHSLIRNGNSYK